MGKVTEVLVWAQFISFRVTPWVTFTLCPPIVPLWQHRQRKQLEEGWRAPGGDRHGQGKAIVPVSWSLSPGTGSPFLSTPGSRQMCSGRHTPPQDGGVCPLPLTSNPRRHSQPLLSVSPFMRARG